MSSTRYYARVLFQYHLSRVTSTGTEQVPGSDDDSAVTRVTPVHGHGRLSPFRKGDPRAADAGRKGGVARRANASARVKSIRATAQILEEISGTFDRERLGTHAASVAGWLMAQIAAGQIPVRNGDEAATLLRALVDVARLESGDPTSNTVVAHLGTDAMARVIALRDQARAAIDATTTMPTSDVMSRAATAAHDIPGHDPPTG